MVLTVFQLVCDVLAKGGCWQEESSAEKICRADRRSIVGIDLPK